MLTNSERLDMIAEQVEALKATVTPKPRPWTATHRHKRTGQLAREVTRAIDMDRGRTLVIYEMLGTPGPLTRAEETMEFGHNWGVIDRAGQAVA